MRFTTSPRNLLRWVVKQQCNTEGGVSCCVIFEQYWNIYDRTHTKLHSLWGENCCPPHFYCFQANGKDTLWFGFLDWFRYEYQIFPIISFVVIKKVKRCMAIRWFAPKKVGWLHLLVFGSCLVNIWKRKIVCWYRNVLLRSHNKYFIDKL